MPITFQIRLLVIAHPDWSAAKLLAQLTADGAVAKLSPANRVYQPHAALRCLGLFTD